MNNKLKILLATMLIVAFGVLITVLGGFTILLTLYVIESVSGPILIVYVAPLVTLGCIIIAGFMEMMVKEIKNI